MNQEQFLQDACEAAKLGGAELLSRFQQNTEVQFKDEFHDIGSLFSEADLASEKAILTFLQEKYPDHTFQSEEAGKNNKESDYFWSIDPLDGTSNFLRNIPLYGVSIALLCNNVPIVGVLFFPSLDLLVSAQQGEGAYANGQRISVSKRPLHEALYFAGGKYRGVTQVHPGIFEAVSMVKTLSASSYELASIACGNAELYYLSSVLHDVAAGVVIVQEAGGRVSDGEGNAWTPESKMIVVSNGVIHDEIVARLLAE